MAVRQVKLGCSARPAGCGRFDATTRFLVAQARFAFHRNTKSDAPRRPGVGSGKGTEAVSPWPQAAENTLLKPQLMASTYHLSRSLQSMPAAVSRGPRNSPTYNSAIVTRIAQLEGSRKAASRRVLAKLAGAAARFWNNGITRYSPSPRAVMLAMNPSD